MHWFLTLHFGYDYTAATIPMLDSGIAPTGPINWLTYVRPSFFVGVRW